MRWLTFLALVLLATLTASAAEPELSKEVAGLRGRIIAHSREKHTQLTLELHNDKSLPRWVITHDPFAFDLTVRDADGKTLAPDAERLDVLSSPGPAIISRECYLGMPVTLDPGSDEKWNLDITTKLWKLKPGKYKLTGVYRIDPKKPRTDLYPAKIGEAYEWDGEIVCPEIEITVKGP